MDNIMPLLKPGIFLGELYEQKENISAMVHYFAFLIYVIFFLFPNLMGIYYSFTDWNARSASGGLKFIGMQNYIDIFTTDKEYSRVYLTLLDLQ